MKKISLVIPMYYEEEVANECYEKVSSVLKKLEDKYDYEIIFVNDGSKDKTLEILENIAKDDKKAKIISFSRNFGHQAAVTAGLKEVSGDAIVIIDADLQDPPELIPEMLELWEQGNEVIYGKRKTRKGESAFKLLTAKMFYKTLNALSDVEIPKDTGDFRLVDRKVVDVINSLPEHNKFLRGLFSWVGFKQEAYELNLNLYQYALDLYKYDSEVSKKSQNALSTFVLKLEKANDLLEGEHTSQEFSGIMLDFLNDIKYFDYLQENEEDGDDRALNVRSLISDIANTVTGKNAISIEEYLQNVTLLTSQDDIVNDGDSITLMTCHTAKGLEFNYVFVVGLNKDVFPNYRAIL